jgi:hypothetical protein
MKQTVERRDHSRYDLRLPLRYRVSLKGSPPYIGTGLTQDMSVHGISFRCRKPLPIGAHVELLVDWPVKHGNGYPLELQVTGFILRSGSGKTAVRMTSHRLRICEIPGEMVRATA